MAAGKEPIYEGNEADDKALSEEPRARLQEQLGEGVMDWLSGTSRAHWMYGVAHIKDRKLERLGVPQDGFMEVVDDWMTARQSMEDAAQTERGMNPGPHARPKPWAEAALKFSWERLTSVQEVSTVYLWYKHLQESALAFRIPMMPFRGITLQHKAYGLMLPGMGHSLWKDSGRFLLWVLRPGRRVQGIR